MKYSVTSSGFSTVDLTSNPEKGIPGLNKEGLSRLTAGENIRFTSDGGCSTRAGFLKLISLGTSLPVDNIKYMPEFDIQFCKSGTHIYQSNDKWVTKYDIGLARTSTELDFLYPYQRNMYATNGTDGLVRIACSTLFGAITGASTQLTLRSGDTVGFAASGTVYIEGDAISYTSISGDTLLGVTGIDANHAAGTIVTQTAAQASLLATCISELENSLLLGIGRTVYCSAKAITGSPQFAYDWSGNGAVSMDMPQSITALHNSSGIVMIGMKKGINYGYAFDIDSGDLLWRKLSGVHSVPSSRSIVDHDDGFYVFTGRRVLSVLADGGGVRIVDNPDQIRDELQLDYPIRSDLLKADEDQSLAWSHYDPFSREYSLTAYMSFISKDYIYQRDTHSWSTDITKSFKCKTNSNSKVYAGSDNTDKIYLDRDGRVDDTLAFRTRMVTPIYTVNNGRATSDYYKATFGGLLSPAGSFKFRVYVNGSMTIEQPVTSDDLISAGLMNIESGTPAGSGVVGAEGINAGAGFSPTYQFIYPFEFFLTGERIQFEWEVLDEGTVLELRSFEIEGETVGQLDASNF